MFWFYIAKRNIDNNLNINNLYSLITSHIGHSLLWYYVLLGFGFFMVNTLVMLNPK